MLTRNGNFGKNKILIEEEENNSCHVIPADIQMKH